MDDEGAISQALAEVIAALEACDKEDEDSLVGEYVNVLFPSILLTTDVPCSNMAGNERGNGANAFSICSQNGVLWCMGTALC